MVSARAIIIIIPIHTTVIKTKDRQKQCFGSGILVQTTKKYGVASKELIFYNLFAPSLNLEKSFI